MWIGQKLSAFMRGIIVRVHGLKPVRVIVAAHAAKEVHGLAPLGFGLASGHHLLPHDSILETWGALV
jgi:hypothetical protein